MDPAYSGCLSKVIITISLFTTSTIVHTFTSVAFTSSDKLMQGAAYHALSTLHFNHPLPLATFVSTLVILGAKPVVLSAAGFDVTSPNVHLTRTQRGLLLGQWLVLVERLSQYAMSFFFSALD